MDTDRCWIFVFSLRSCSNAFRSYPNHSYSFLSFTIPLLNGVAARLLGYKRMWLYAGYLYMITLLITPICALTLSSPSWVYDSSLTDNQVQWFVIYSIYAVSYVARILQFTAVIVIISNVSYPDFRGKVNGIGQVFASLGRFIVRKEPRTEF